MSMSIGRINALQAVADEPQNGWMTTTFHVNSLPPPHTVPENLLLIPFAMPALVLSATPSTPERGRPAPPPSVELQRRP